MTKTDKATINDAFAGKTIKSVQADSVNVWTFQFTDGSEQQIEADQAVLTSYGSVAGIFLSAR